MFCKAFLWQSQEQWKNPYGSASVGVMLEPGGKALLPFLFFIWQSQEQWKNPYGSAGDLFCGVWVQHGVTRIGKEKSGS